MNQSIEQRMQTVEDELKQIRKELEESLARYKDKHYPFNADLDPRTATGYGLRYLAQEAGVDFDALDTDAQVRNKLEDN